MATNDPIAPSGALPPTCGISKTTISVAGIALDIFGLTELTPNQTKITCLWLEHGRKRRREDMAKFAERMVSATLNHETNTGSVNSKAVNNRGLIAIAFDQRNHGSRITDPLANGTWKSGNARHAQDMFSTVTGSAVDTMHLIDVLEGYLWLEDELVESADVGGGGGRRRRVIDQHLVLGVSMGGHCAWQLLFEDPRVVAGVVVIGCPDYMRLMSARAEKSKLSPENTSFIGSVHFPPALVAAAKRWDPKGRLFGTGAVPSSSGNGTPDASLASRLDKTAIRGKKIQILSGGKDNLVPYSAAKPFLDWFKDAVTGWYKHAGVEVEDNVYPEAGHEFSEEMQKDAVRFVLGCMGTADGLTEAAAGGRVGSPKM